MKNKGQSPIGIITGIGGVIAFIASIITPVLYVGQIKENVAVLDNRVSTTEKNIDKLTEDSTHIRAILDEWAVRNKITVTRESLQSLLSTTTPN